MPKRIIICADGTWNVPDQRDGGKPCPTNVLKIARAILPTTSDGTQQVVYYHPGVGTNWGLDRWFGGAFGLGLSRNIKDCYRFLADNYAEGDEIYFFGFSRGAFTVRSTVGLIRKCGLMLKAHMDRFPEAFELYRRRIGGPDLPGAVSFRASFSRIVKIKFIGVWDTVGALGIPGNTRFFLSRKRFQFHDVKLSSYVQNAYHALAIDEKRKPFKPTLWEQQTHSTGQTMEQIWFAGVHSGVGGGYADSGLSDIAFIWMKEKAESKGIAFDEKYIQQTILPNWKAGLRESLTWLYKLFGVYRRPIGLQPDWNDEVDQSAVDRYRESVEGYQPPNLKAYLAGRGA
jgi:uncharacterized protein (DUF2235 family)